MQEGADDNKSGGGSGGSKKKQLSPVVIGVLVLLLVIWPVLQLLQSVMGGEGSPRRVPAQPSGGEE